MMINKVNKRLMLINKMIRMQILIQFTKPTRKYCDVIKLYKLFIHKKSFNMIKA